MADVAGRENDWRLAALCFTILVGIFGALAILASRVIGSEEKKPEPAQAGGQRRRGALDRMQRNMARNAAADDGEGEEDDGADAGPATRRDAVKQQRKQEKKEQQTAQRQMREQQDSKKSEKQMAYAERQAKKEAERQRREEEEERLQKEKEQREQEEFDKWKEEFAIDAEGEEAQVEFDQYVVERFLEHIKLRKVVILEELAKEFKMKTNAVIDRLQQLEKLGRINGIFDDRGKFMYITAEEMAAVADWINKSGRVSRSAVVAACNRLVSLEGTPEEELSCCPESSESAANLQSTSPN